MILDECALSQHGKLPPVAKKGRVFFNKLWQKNLHNALFCPSELRREFCNWETFEAECSPAHVVLMTSAHYGRMNAGRCIQLKYDDKGQPDPMGCSDNIIRYCLKI